MEREQLLKNIYKPTKNHRKAQRIFDFCDEFNISLNRIIYSPFIKIPKLTNNECEILERHSIHSWFDIRFNFPCYEEEERILYEAAKKRFDRETRQVAMF